jgi:hypothetical protein
VSYATKHKLETVRDWFFLALGISLIGAGFWNMEFMTGIAFWSWNVMSLIGSGIIVTLVAVALLMRLRRKTL